MMSLGTATHGGGWTADRLHRIRSSIGYGVSCAAWSAALGEGGCSTERPGAGQGPLSPRPAPLILEG